jgi:hypothetical protein
LERDPRSWQGGIKQTSRLQKTRENQKTSPARKTEENKNKTEAEGLLLNRQKAWTCGLAWQTILPKFV